MGVTEGPFSRIRSGLLRPGANLFNLLTFPTGTRGIAVRTNVDSLKFSSNLSSSLPDGNLQEVGID